MQWLIDLIAEKVIAEIGVPPCYIDRGDPGEPDYIDSDLLKDLGWQELDLSGIVPAGAVAVHLRVWVNHDETGNYIQFRKAGNTGEINVFTASTQLANIYNFQEGTVALDEDRKIEYRIIGDDWVLLFVTVGGWWL